MFWKQTFKNAIIVFELYIFLHTKQRENKMKHEKFNIK